MLCLEKVNVYYGEIHALKDVSFRVAEGTVAALCGDVGSGRSTCLKTIAGTIRPSAGTVSFRGRDLAGEQAENLGIIQVAEERRIFAGMTVLENLQVTASQPEYAARIETALRVFPPLRLRQHKPAGSLPGEEQQMLIIARALLRGPALLLLDEPTRGLGPAQAEAFLRCIPAINALGVTILLAEQNMDLALAAADECYFFAGGQIAREGRAAEFAGAAAAGGNDGF
ncbi:MAG: ATP-binding cassette domain-containing protein [Gracilibacteraceae bacterium]|jgi:branched-chain amino acid transport system ATP-binding protein|nr:ATP-binding cassette domain-containing protein [Gracilibacteraceae bacterium]